MTLLTLPLSSRAVDADMDHDDLGAGLHVFRVAAPLDRAGSLAVRLGADLCTTLPEADTMVAERRALPNADTDTLESLRGLAQRVAAAQRIAQRTLERAAAAVADRMAGPGAGLAVHPSTIRERAATVEHARTELRQAGHLLEANDATDATDATDAEDLLVPPPVDPVAFEPPPPSHAAPALPRRRLFGFLRRGQREAEDTRESSDLLRSMAAATDEAFGARRASMAQSDQRILLVARRDSAAEVVRVAERAWYDLAGEGAEPSDVEAVLHRLDPQHQDAVLMAKETVSVRAASSVFDRAMGRWQASWADLDLDPPAPGEAMESVDRLIGQLTKAVVLVGAATERGLDVAKVAPTAPVVVVETVPDGTV